MKARETNYYLIKFCLYAMFLLVAMMLFVVFVGAENTIQYNSTVSFNYSLLILNESVNLSVSNGSQNIEYTNLPNIPYPLPFERNFNYLLFFNLPNYTFYIQNSTVVYEQNITYIVNFTNSTYINNTCMPVINYSQIPNLTITCPNVLINDSSNISITIDNIAVLNKLELFYNLSARNDCPLVVDFMNASVQPVLYQNKYLQDRSEFLQKEISRVELNNTMLEQARQYQDALLSYVGLVAFVLFVLFVALIVIISMQFGWGEQQ